MNIKNLKKALKFLKTIPEDSFSMDDFRSPGDIINQKCGSVGCIIGWCTALDTPENLDKFRIHNRVPESRHKDFNDGNTIMFFTWSENFFGIGRHNKLWDYLFSTDWSKSPLTNTPEHAIYRLSMVITGYNITDDYIYDIVDTEIERLELIKG